MKNPMMKQHAFWSGLICVFALVGCGSGGGGSSPTATQGLPFNRVAGPNTMNIYVSDPQNCLATGYENEPCVSVTVCNNDDSNTCKTVNGILLDTGSFGLRVFASALTGLSLTPVKDKSGNPIGECAQFASNSDWGSVQIAKVVLGTEQPVTVPIQVIDPSFATAPSECATVDASASGAGFNGILGVGLKAQDCGPDCTVANNGFGQYFSCNGSKCVEAAMPLASQVINPVAALPVDNNGVIVTFGAVGSSGVNTDAGQLILGIGTEANNVPAAGVTLYQANSNLNFNGSLQGVSFPGQAFLDSGSNGMFFPGQIASIPQCSQAQGFFCPSSVLSLTASMQGVSSGSAVFTYAMQIGNAESLFNSGDSVFSDIGGQMNNALDFGLPFFLGRTVYVGIQNAKAQFNGNAATGPYWAF
jgi:hypothetical protein